jgi:hypothetical protein
MNRDPNPFAERETEVETAILEAIASGPATPMTDEIWQELHRRVREVHSHSSSEHDRHSSDSSSTRPRCTGHLSDPMGLDQ